MPATPYMLSPRTRVRHAAGGPVTVSDGTPHLTRVNLYGPDIFHRAQVVVRRGRDQVTWTAYDVPPYTLGYWTRCGRETSLERCAMCLSIRPRVRISNPSISETRYAGVYRCVCGESHTTYVVVRNCQDCGERSGRSLDGGLLRAASYYPPAPQYDSDSDNEADDVRTLPGRAGDPREWYLTSRSDCCGRYTAKWGLPHAGGRPVYAGRYRADRHGVFPAAFRRRAAAALAALGRRAERATSYSFCNPAIVV